MLTRWVLFHLLSGQAFFAGIACLVAAVGLSDRAGQARWRRARNLLTGMGGVLVAGSSTPLPAAAYLGLAVVSLLWVGGEAASGRWPRRWVGGIRLAMAASWCLAGLAEVPHHLVPRVPLLGHPVLGVVGDSLTAGVGDRGEVTWPTILADRHGVVVHDHAAPGATAASAARTQAGAVTPDERLVVVEIGGNDLLGGTTPEAFEAGLAGLLGTLRTSGRTVVLLELPLPPGSVRFGAIQRRLARRFGALLVPKRVLLGVLLGPEATLDSIHLGPPGHDRMAAAIWDVIRPAYGGDPAR